MVRARQRDTGRSLCFRGAHFLRFRDGKLVAFRSIADTFDVAQQVVGHPIDVTKPIEHVPLVPEEDALLSCEASRSGTATAVMRGLTRARPQTRFRSDGSPRQPGMKPSTPSASARRGAPGFPARS